MATTTPKVTQGAAAVPNAQVEGLAKAKSDLDHMRDYFKNQPKVTIKIPKDRGEQFVAINGYPFRIAAGVSVQVPERIAQELRNASVI